MPALRVVIRAKANVWEASIGLGICALASVQAIAVTRFLSGTANPGDAPGIYLDEVN